MPVRGDAGWDVLARLGVEVRPLPVEWPGRRTPPAEVERSSFNATLETTIEGLATELRQHEAEGVHLHLDIPESRLRNDGLPYRGRSPSEPPVMLSFHYPRLDERVRYPCDRYASWKCNLRAIVLTLASLRAIDRYGVLRHGEQYRGSQYQLGPGEDEPMTEVEAALVVYDCSSLWLKSPISDEVVTDRDEIAKALLGRPELFKRLYRNAVKGNHPDTGPHHDPVRWRRLQRARELVEAVHERRALVAG